MEFEKDNTPFINKVKKWAIIGGIIVIGCIAAFFAYNYLKKPEKILTEIINKSYKEFQNNLDKLDNSNNEDLNIFSNSIKVSGDLKVNNNDNYANNEKISFDLGLDYSGKKASALVNYYKNNTKEVDAGLYFLNNKVYLKSNTLLDNTYEVGDANFYESFDLDSIKEAYQNSQKIDLDKLDLVVKNFKDALINSLDSGAMSKSTEVIVIDDESISANKISYKVDASTMRNLLDTFIDEFMKNEQVLDIIAENMDISKEDIKKVIKEVNSKELIPDSTTAMDFNIYVKGFNNDIKRVELIDPKSGENITFSKHKDKIILNYGTVDEGLKIIIKKEQDEHNVDIYIDDELISTLVVRQIDKNGIDFDFEIMGEDDNISGTFMFTKEDKNTKEFGGKLLIDVSYNEMSYGIDFNYNVKWGAVIESINTKNALTEITEADSKKAQEKIESLEGTIVYNILDNMFLFSTSKENLDDVKKNAFASQAYMILGDAQDYVIDNVLNGNSDFKDPRGVCIDIATLVDEEYSYLDLDKYQGYVVVSYDQELENYDYRVWLYNDEYMLNRAANPTSDDVLENNGSSKNYSCDASLYNVVK